MNTNTARDLNTKLAATHGWTDLGDGRLAKGDHVIDVTYTAAGSVTYGALFGTDRQLDHIDRRTSSKRARVASWLTYR